MPKKIIKKRYKFKDTKSTLKDIILNILIMTFPGLNLWYTIYLSKINNDKKELEKQIKDLIDYNHLSEETINNVKENTQGEMVSIPPIGEVATSEKKKVKLRVMEDVQEK